MATKPNSKLGMENCLPVTRERNMEGEQQRQILPPQSDPGAGSGLRSLQPSVDFFWNGNENTRGQPSRWI